MIVRLAPEQIAQIWEYVRPGIVETLAPIASKSHESAQRVLRGLLSEDMQLWLGLEDPTDFTDKSIYGFMVTTIYKDIVSETRSLLVYALFETRDIPHTVWMVGLKKLRDYAQVQNCRDISAYSNVPRMIELCKSLGFESTTFLRKEV